jgi:hypothetical protein
MSTDGFTGAITYADMNVRSILRQRAGKANNFKVAASLRPSEAFANLIL